MLIGGWVIPTNFKKIEPPWNLMFSTVVTLIFHYTCFPYCIHSNNNIWEIVQRVKDSENVHPTLHSHVTKPVNNTTLTALLSTCVYSTNVELELSISSLSIRDFDCSLSLSSYNYMYIINRNTCISKHNIYVLVYM